MALDSSLPLIQDMSLYNRIVLVRVDHNVVKKGRIKDPFRIDSTFPTLFHIVRNGGRMILMSHVGRPRDKKTGIIKISDDTSVHAVVDYFKSKLGLDFAVPEFAVDGDHGYTAIDTSINHLIQDLWDGSIDGIYLPNTRWFYGEEDQGIHAQRFAGQLSGLADLYVNDAFGSWQSHTSTVGVTEHMPSCAGLLMQQEIENLDKVLNARKPMLAVVAGAKFDTKIGPLSALLRKADNLVLGGVIYNAYLSAKYGFRINGIDDDEIESAKKFVELADKHPGKIIELQYIVESDTLDGKIEGKHRVRNIKELPEGAELNYILDVAPESFEAEGVKEKFMNAKTIFVNAVMGLTPHFPDGTIALDTLIDQNKGAMKLFGGGDTLQEMKNYLPGLYMNAIDNPAYNLFTGGGAVLKAIQENSPYGLPPVAALKESYKKYSE